MRDTGWRLIHSPLLLQPSPLLLREALLLVLLVAVVKLTLIR
jgi:hypothetical protein